MARGIAEMEPAKNEVTKFAVASRRALQPSRPASFPIINKPRDFRALAVMISADCIVVISIHSVLQEFPVKVTKFFEKNCAARIISPGVGN
jgi:hypothetical protein